MKIKFWILLALLLLAINRNVYCQISLKIKNSDGKFRETPLDSICTISQSALNKKALSALYYPNISEKEFLGYNGYVQYEFTFTTSSIIETKLTYGFSTNRFTILDNAHRPQKMDSLLFDEHKRVFEKVKKYLRLKEGTIYVMRIPVKFEWDEKNEKSVDDGIFIIDKKYQLKGAHDKNAKC
jgi:hypothetical protein